MCVMYTDASATRVGAALFAVTDGEEKPVPLFRNNSKGHSVDTVLQN